MAPTKSSNKKDKETKEAKPTKEEKPKKEKTPAKPKEEKEKTEKPKKETKKVEKKVVKETKETKEEKPKKEKATKPKVVKAKKDATKPKKEKLVKKNATKKPLKETKPKKVTKTETKKVKKTEKPVKKVEKSKPVKKVHKESSSKLESLAKYQQWALEAVQMQVSEDKKWVCDLKIKEYVYQYMEDLSPRYKTLVKASLDKLVESQILLKKKNSYKPSSKGSKYLPDKVTRKVQRKPVEKPHIEAEKPSDEVKITGSGRLVRQRF